MADTVSLAKCFNSSTPRILVGLGISLAKGAKLKGTTVADFSKMELTRSELIKQSTFEETALKVTIKSDPLRRIQVDLNGLKDTFNAVDGLNRTLPEAKRIKLPINQGDIDKLQKNVEDISTKIRVFNTSKKTTSGESLPSPTTVVHNTTKSAFNAEGYEIEKAVTSVDKQLDRYRRDLKNAIELTTDATAKQKMIDSVRSIEAKSSETKLGLS